MQLRSEALHFGQMAGIVPPRSDIERVLDPVLKEASTLARFNDPRGLYAYCWCSEPGMPAKGPTAR